jgi:thioredoxin 1
VTAQDKLVMVEWSATWCGPCKAVEPKLVELEEEMSSELKVYKIIYDSNPGFKSLAKAFEIQALPSFQVRGGVVGPGASRISLVAVDTAHEV